MSLFVACSVSFSYPGPFSGYPEDPGVSKALWDSDFSVERVLFANSIRFKHQYSFTDGSLFKYIYIPEGEYKEEEIMKNTLFNRLDDAFKCEKVYVLEIYHRVDADREWTDEDENTFQQNNHQGGAKKE